MTDPEPASPPLAPGLFPVPAGHIANVVTYFEMTAPPPAQEPTPLPPGTELARFENADVAAYRDLFRRVGEAWMWYSRLVMPDEDVQWILADPRVEIFVLQRDREAIGLLELDFREEGECELAFLGVVPEAIGQGWGLRLMEEAMAHAWSRPLRRLWLHTCNFDHPKAPDFYRRSGLRAFALAVEVALDPRLTGHVPKEAAPHVPLIEP